MPVISFKHLIKETVQQLHEVKPFVDPKLKTKPTDPVQYIATNDHRYPSEIAFFDTKKNEVVFFNIQQKEVERVSVDRLNSTHWVRDYLKNEFGDYDGHSPSGNIKYEGKVNEEDYKYKKQVAKAFNKINDEMFNFRHSMGLKQLTNKDMKLKKKVESLQQGIFNLQKELKSQGLTEGKYDHMVGKSFKLPGRGQASMRITRIEDDRFVHASPYDEWVKYDDKASSNMYDIKKVIQHNPEIDTKQVKKRTAWNKGTGNPHLITKREYAKVLMGAMKDMKSMGDEEHTHDVAQSMIYDQGILARLVKDNPGKNSTQLTQQLQWDLEAAA